MKNYRKDDGPARHWLSRQAMAGGQALLMVVVMFLFLSNGFIIGISDPILRQANMTRDFLTSHKSYFLSESAVEDVIYRLKNGKQVPANGTLVLDGGTATVSIIDVSGGKNVSVSSNMNSLVRKIGLVIGTGSGISFSYGIQSGAGGMELKNNAVISGSVYSNGSIKGSNGAKVTGTAISVGLIDSLRVGENGVGDAEANEVKNSVIAGSLYCQTGSGNNKSCNTSKGVPVSQDFYITDSMITTWKSEAAEGGVINGDYILGSFASLGPKKINGNLKIDGDKTLTMTGTVWVTGNIELENGAKVKLNSSYGDASGMLISDGKIEIENNSTFSGSGQSGSYIMVLSTSDCPMSGYCDGDSAIDISNNGGAVILNAQKGTIHMHNNSGAKEVVAYKTILDNGATVTYDSGLMNSKFTNGPTGGWTIKEWKEIE